MHRQYALWEGQVDGRDYFIGRYGDFSAAYEPVRTKMHSGEWKEIAHPVERESLRSAIYELAVRELHGRLQEAQEAIRSFGFCTSNLMDARGTNCEGDAQRELDEARGRLLAMAAKIVETA